MQDSKEEDPWECILAATMFVVHVTVHTTLQVTPMQLVFGHDVILNTIFEADWQLIKNQKQKVIQKNNMHKNKKCKPYTYLVREKVLI